MKSFFQKPSQFCRVIRQRKPLSIVMESLGDGPKGWRLLFFSLTAAKETKFTIYSKNIEGDNKYVSWIGQRNIILPATHTESLKTQCPPPDSIIEKLTKTYKGQYPDAFLVTSQHAHALKRLHTHNGKFLPDTFVSAYMDPKKKTVHVKWDPSEKNPCLGWLSKKTAHFHGVTIYQCPSRSIVEVTNVTTGAAALLNSSVSADCCFIGHVTKYIRSKQKSIMFSQAPPLLYTVPGGKITQEEIIEFWEYVDKDRREKNVETP